MFASRGCDVDQALVYANDVISAMPVEVQSHAMTALMVVVNTAANAFTQATGPSPAQEVAAAWVRDLVAQEIDKHATGLQDKVGELVTEWIDGNLDGKLDDWANNSLAFEDACDNRVERWIENNLDLSDQIESAINDMDLVVRVR
jgi:N-acetylglutamate synthase/N-acetylornithine aminotransferase